MKKFSNTKPSTIHITMKHSNMILPEACETDSLFEPYATKFMTLRQSIGFLADVYVHTAEITKPISFIPKATNIFSIFHKLYTIYTKVILHRLFSYYEVCVLAHSQSVKTEKK